MGSTISLTAADGHTLSAWRTGPEDAKHGLVVIQEIFGVNHHIRNVADRFAAQGYLCIAPALFDRIRPGIEIGYTGADIATGRDLRLQVPEEGTMADIAAAAAALGGYCWGGSLAWLGATRTTLFAAASGWYGGAIAATRTETPHCPVQLHFGAEDHGIPLSDVELIRAAQPGIEIDIYPGAGHGFGCDERGSYSAPDAALAQQRTLAFFARNLA